VPPDRVRPPAEGVPDLDTPQVAALPETSEDAIPQVRIVAAELPVLTVGAARALLRLLLEADRAAAARGASPPASADVAS